MSTNKFFSMPVGTLRRRLDQSAIYDWAMRCPIVAYSLFILARDVFAFSQQLQHDPGLFERFDGNVAVLARLSQWMFVILLSLLPLFRLRPIAKSEDMLPRIGALVAVCLPLMFMQLERAPASLAFNLPALAVGLFANVMAVVTVSFLGRSLSVMPEARRLVESGPYSIVRHPLYLCEMLGIGAVFLQYRSLPAAGLLLLATALQVKRARWEENVLARAFPDFAAYRSRTSFLIPSNPMGLLATFVATPTARRRLALIIVIIVTLMALTATVPWRLAA
ncbi:MAG: methyltransferase [Xanthobacteraceae bacterium]